MQKLLKIIVLILITNLNLYSCALCALYTPSAHISFTQNKVYWEFSENFNQTLLDGFDINNDKTLDNKELIQIRASLLDYLIPKNYLMKLSYYDLPYGQIKDIEINVKNVNLSFDKTLKLDYEIYYDFTPQDNRVLIFSIEDPAEFFNFKIVENTLFVDGFIIEENANLNANYYKFIKANEQVKEEVKPKQNETNQNTIKNSNIFDKLKSLYDKCINLLFKLQQKLIYELKENSIYLYPLAFIYGFLHALLPNHGKSLSAAYFMNSKRKILSFSLKVGFLHLINAFFIATFFSFFNIFNLSYLQGFFISFIALILLYIKLNNKKVLNIKTQNNTQKLSNFKTYKTDSKVLNIVKNPSVLDNFSAFIIALIPCPGLIIVIGLISSTGIFAIIAAILIALGMSLAIYLSAFIVTRFKFHKNIEIIFLIIIFIIGLFIGFSK